MRKSEWVWISVNMRNGPIRKAKETEEKEGDGD